MEKVLFFSSYNISNGRLNYDGVTKKINLEIKTFRDFGCTVDYIVQNNGIIYLQKESGEQRIIIKSSGRYYKDFERVYSKLIEMAPELSYDVLYMRFEGATYRMKRFLKFLRENNPNIKIFAEMPTYHTLWEPGTKFTGKIRFIARHILNNIFSTEFDKIITFDNRNFLYHRPTLRIENFADVNKLPLRENKEINGDIHLVAIAQLTPSHGFDRVIKGLGEYYKDYHKHKVRNVYLHIIGDGYVKKEWENLTTHLGLNDYIIFEGSKSTDEITSYINQSQLAIACLAIFRKNCLKASELKIREYCARGIPFIYSSNEPILDGQNWCLKVPHDESPININQIIEFIESQNYNEVSLQMRNFALEYCTPESQLKKVINEMR